MPLRNWRLKNETASEEKGENQQNAKKELESLNVCPFYPTISTIYHSLLLNSEPFQVVEMMKRKVSL
jgi:hypothetical protein